VPLYDYAPTSGECAQCQGRFEVFQRVADEKLTSCPACGKPCERLIGPVAVGGKYSTSDSRVKELGMTKYVKRGDGYYERTASTGGPQIIRQKGQKDS
jgi:putative FmdB family regulatory protein